jgi:hypothetical protein
MPTRIERYNPRTLSQPTRRLSPLAGIASQPVQKQDGPTVTAEVNPCEMDTVSLEEQLRSHVQVPITRSVEVLHTDVVTDDPTAVTEATISATLRAGGQDFALPSRYRDVPSRSEATRLPLDDYLTAKRHQRWRCHGTPATSLAPAHNPPGKRLPGPRPSL